MHEFPRIVVTKYHKKCLKTTNLFFHSSTDIDKRYKLTRKLERKENLDMHTKNLRATPKIVEL